MKRAIVFSLLATLSFLVLTPAPARSQDMKKDKAAAGTVHEGKGKVTKVDAAGGSVTIAHGPVASMSWPAMTMSFKAKDKASLQKVKPGDQVEFSFVESGKDHLITGIK